MLSAAQLVTLRAVLRHGSFTGAAAALNYTASAVSQQMSALERVSGLSLFERTPHAVRPTEYARLLADRSADLLTVLDQLDRDVAALARGEAGRLRIGSFPTASARLLPPALAALTRDRPGVEIEVDEGELDVLLPRLIAGELDLALAYRYDAVPVSWPAALSETELLRESLWVLIPDGHRLASSHTVGLGSLRAARWVAPLAGSPGAVNLDRLAATAGFTPRVSFRSNDYSVVRGLVAAGLGVALVPGLALRDEPGVLARPLGSGAGRGRSRRGREVVALHRRTTGNALVSAALAAMTHPSGTHPSGIVRPDVSAAPGVS